MDWDKKVIRPTMEGAGQYPGVQLHLLLMRLQEYPEAFPAIAAAVRDMGAWCMAQADELDAEARRRAIKATPEK